MKNRTSIALGFIGLFSMTSAVLAAPKGGSAPTVSYSTVKSSSPTLTVSALTPVVAPTSCPPSVNVQVQCTIRSSRSQPTAPNGINISVNNPPAGWSFYGDSSGRKPAQFVFTGMTVTPVPTSAVFPVYSASPGLVNNKWICTYGTTANWPATNQTGPDQLTGRIIWLSYGR